MKNISFIRLALGIGIILAGVAALLGAFDIINFNHLVSSYWPVLLMVAAIVVLIDSPRQNYIWAILFAIVGVMAQLNMMDVISIHFWQLVWPVVLIAIGWSVLTQHIRAKNNSVEKITAILSGAESKSRSTDFKGSILTTVMGGASIDLSKATIKKEATIEVLAIMGGAELRVPEGWEVRVSVTPILGGIENKASSPTKSGAPVLNIVGTVIMGGVEIKN